jgi:Flp pilus assembly protein TadG
MKRVNNRLDFAGEVTGRRLHRKHGERGSVALLYAVIMLVMMAFAGLAIDVGYMQWQKRRIQAAADAAAMGALRELELNHTSNVTLAGQNDAALNGFTNGQNSTTVTINNPPGFGTYAGNGNAVEVVIQKTFPTFFMMALGQNSVNVAGRAVAMTAAAYGSIGGCIFALHPTGSSVLKINGSYDVHTSCSAIDESSDPSALTMSGSQTWHFTTHNAHFGVAGGWSVNGSAKIVDDTTGKTEDPKQMGSPGDPFYNVLQPSPSNVAVTTIQDTNGNYTDSTPANHTLNPGVYCGGIRVGNTHGVTLKLNAGTYILAGGGLTLGGQAIVDGTAGVTFFNTSGGWGCGGGGGGYAPVHFDGGAKINLKAPTSGNQAGIMIFEDRSITDSSYNQILGNSSSTFDGALYFKNSPLKFAGTNSVNGYLVAVADTISIEGNTTMGNNYSSLPDPNPFAPGSTGGGLVQ